MAHAPINEPVFYEEVPTEDASADQAALEARVDAELGLPTKEETTDGDSGATDTGIDTSDTAGDGASADADGVDKSKDKSDAAGGDETPTKKAEVPEQPDPVEPFITVQDASGKDFKITKIEDLPEDFTPRNNRQVIEILSNLNKLEADNTKAAAAAQETAKAEEAKAAQAAQMKAWDSEIEQLQKDGRLVAPKAAPDSEKYLDDPAVKRVDAVFKFMAETNDKRMADGSNSLIRSFEDALDKMELAERRQADEDANKQETANAKAKSGLIGRTSSGDSQPPSYFAGQYSSIDDIPIG